MIAVSQIASVLGGETILHEKVRSPNDLRLLIEKGLPKKSVVHVFSQLFEKSSESRSHFYELIPEATFKRRKDRLKMDESEKVERIARVIATALYVWDNDEEQLRVFFLFPHSEFNDKTPLDICRTELGARQVEEILWKIFYGISS